MKSKSILLADDHSIVRKGLRLYILKCLDLKMSMRSKTAIC